MTMEPISEVFVLTADLHKALKLPNLSEMKLWTYRFKSEPLWAIAAAGRGEIPSYKYPGKDESQQVDGWGKLAPFHMHIYYDGWLAAVLNPYRGEFLSHPTCNESLYIEAVKQEIREFARSD